jgi:hypothetical protein
MKANSGPDQEIKTFKAESIEIGVLASECLDRRIDMIEMFSFPTWYW